MILYTEPTVVFVNSACASLEGVSSIAATRLYQNEKEASSATYIHLYMRIF